MPEMTIRLQTDPATGKKDITVSLRSDADALPQEHEQYHRELVEKLVEGGLVKAGEIGKVVVEREEAAPESERRDLTPAETDREQQAQGR